MPREIEWVTQLSKKQRQCLLEAIKSMCRVFWGPDDRFCESLQNGSLLAPLEALTMWMPVYPRDVIEQIKDYSHEFTDVSSFCSHIEKTYVRLFINNRYEMTIPLYQSCYACDNAPLMGKAALDMRERFESKGLSLDYGMSEPPDHLCIELEYFYFLLANGWEGENKALIDEAMAFATGELIPWLKTFSVRLSGNSTGRFYSLFASLLLSILNGMTAKKSPPAR